MNVQHSRFPRHFCSLNLVFGRTTSKMLTAWHKRAIASARLVKTPWDSMLLILHIRHIRPQPSVDISSIRGFQWIPIALVQPLVNWFLHTSTTAPAWIGVPGLPGTSCWSLLGKPGTSSMLKYSGQKPWLTKEKNQTIIQPKTEMEWNTVFG